MKYQMSSFKYQINTNGYKDHWTLDIGYWILKIPHGSEVGQALVTLLFFMIMGVTITTVAVVVVLTNALSATTIQQGASVNSIAESGIDEGLLHLLRTPNFSGTETFSAGEGSVTVTIGNNTITATGSATNSVRTIQVKTVYNNNTLTIVSRKEL